MKLIEEHQNETINTLNKELEAVDKKIQKLMDQREIISECIAKVQTAVLMTQFDFLKGDQN